MQVQRTDVSWNIHVDWIPFLAPYHQITASIGGLAPLSVDPLIACLIGCPQPRFRGLDSLPNIVHISLYRGHFAFLHVCGQLTVVWSPSWPSTSPFVIAFPHVCGQLTVCGLEPFLVIYISICHCQIAFPHACGQLTDCGLEPFLAIVISLCHCQIAFPHACGQLTVCGLGALLGHRHLPLAWPDCIPTCLWPTVCGLEPFLAIYISL